MDRLRQEHVLVCEKSGGRIGARRSAPRCGDLGAPPSKSRNVGGGRALAPTRPFQGSMTSAERAQNMLYRVDGRGYGSRQRVVDALPAFPRGEDRVSLGSSKTPCPRGGALGGKHREQDASVPSRAPWPAVHVQ